MPPRTPQPQRAISRGLQVSVQATSLQSILCTHGEHLKMVVVATAYFE